MLAIIRRYRDAERIFLEWVQVVVVVKRVFLISIYVSFKNVKNIKKNSIFSCQTIIQGNL